MLSMTGLVWNIKRSPTASFSLKRWLVELIVIFTVTLDICVGGSAVCVPTRFA
jgi:hypothetical protein